MFYALARDEEGGLAVVVAVMLMVLIGFAGLTVDVSSWYAQKQRLQLIADAAAVAAAHELAAGGNQKAVTLSARKAAQDNGLTDIGRLQLAIEPSKISVHVTRTLPVFFSKAFRVEPPVARVAAAAGFKPLDACIIALAEHGPGLGMVGAAKISAPDCDVQVNSSSGGAVDLTGAVGIEARRICVAGSVRGNGRHLSPQPDEGCRPMDDPLETLPAPSVPAGCDHNGLAASGTISPGVYCGGLTIAGHARMLPGLYVVKDGPLLLRGNSRLTGEEVVIYLHGSASIDMAGTADVELSAASSGPYAGLVIIGDRDLAAPVPHRLAGNSGKAYRGIVYLPKGDVTFIGSGHANTPSPFNTYIVHRLKLVGAARLAVSNADAGGGTPLPASMAHRPRLIE